LEIEKEFFCLKPKAKRSSNLTPLKANCLKPNAAEGDNRGAEK
jgi:hypothetical protein